MTFVGSSGSVGRAMPCEHFLSPATPQVAARLTFAANLLDLRPLPAWALEVFRVMPSPIFRRIRVSALMTFSAPSARSLRSQNPSHPQQAEDLSSSSLEFSRYTPPPFDFSRVLSHPSRKTGFVPRLSHPDQVPPPWSLTTSTVSSALKLQVYCALLPALRFATFIDARSRPARKLTGMPDAFHVTRFIPFEGFPSFVAVPSSHAPRRVRFTDGRCLLVVAHLANVPSADAPVFRRRPPRQRPKQPSIRPKPKLLKLVETFYRG